jgi:hypothetical protein
MLSVTHKPFVLNVTHKPFVLNVTHKPFMSLHMLNVVMLSVVMLGVVAPMERLKVEAPGDNLTKRLSFAPILAEIRT